MIRDSWMLRGSPFMVHNTYHGIAGPRSTYVQVIWKGLIQFQIFGTRIFHIKKYLFERVE